MQNRIPVQLIFISWLFAQCFCCTNNLNCSLNGVCDTTLGVCHCDAAWSGDSCDKLAIIPHPPKYVGAYGVDPNITSWGGNIIKDDQGLFHLFVSEMADNHGNFCGLKTWTSHSRIAHAVSKDPMGTFHRVDISLPQESHNASPLRAPMTHADGSRPWYLFHIGSASGAPVSNCTTPIPIKKPLSGSFLHRASNPAGPWEALPSISCNNPAPMFHNNGTMYVGCNSGGFKIYRSDDPSAKDSWNHVSDMKFPKSWGGSGSPDSKYLKAEDPYMWMDKRGDWHFIAHRYDYRDGYPPNPNQTMPVLVSGHGFSEDGYTWYFNDVAPYNNWIDFTDGTRKYFATWERPHLVFNDAQEPIYLLNGVSAVWGDKPCQFCDARPGTQHSCVVCKTSKYIDWTYTIVSKLKTS